MITSLYRNPYPHFDRVPTDNTGFIILLHSETAVKYNIG